MKTNFTQELGQLLVYIGQVNKSLRSHCYGIRDITNSVKDQPIKYCGDDYLLLSKEKSSTLDDRLWNILWITDSLHHLDQLGNALSLGDLDSIIVKSASLISMYESYNTCPSSFNETVDCNKPLRSNSIRTFSKEHQRDTNGSYSKQLKVQHSCFSKDLRQTVQRQLNKGEYRHKLPRWIFFANQGEFTTGDYEEIMNKSSNLSLVSNAILYWNTSRISKIVESLREQGEEIDDKTLSHISLLPYKHVLPNGTYFIED